MSTDAENSDETASGRADGDVTPGVRRRGRRILEADPGLSFVSFAARLFDDVGASKDVAAELYDQLTDDQGDADAGDHMDESEPAERDQDAPPSPPPDVAPPSVEPENAGPASAESDAPADQDLAGRITDHYQRLENRDVYGALGAIDADVVDADADLSALGNQDFTGWYRSRDAGGSWDGRGRPWALAREFGDLRDGLERVLYATINYAPAPWFMDAWDRYEWTDDGRTWERGSAPTPGYDAVHAYAPFADVDLADDVKEQRPAGDVPTDQLEEALRRYVDAFAELAGGREHVFALDSVGGAYLFVAPTSTAPIATAFDADDRAAIFDELTDRLNGWLEDVADRVTAATDLAGVFEPDLLNNKNRLYKAPLSVHSSLDGVVTPVDVDDPTYQFTPLEETSGELVDETRAWVDGFTADHRDAVDAIVATLWPEHYGDADDWRDALAAWLEDHREEEARNQDRERQRIPSDEIPDDLETTDDLEIINSKIEGIAVDDLIRKTIGAAVEGEDTDDGDDGVRFDPPWRGSESGQSCFADSRKFYDPDAKYSGGGALEFIAVERGIVNRPGDKLTGDKYWRAVNALRGEGYHIPYFEGWNGRHADVLRLFTEPETDDDRKRQLARALFADE
ncbi:hypothetical protein [Halorubrum ezzemoulense]|uniref:hypothetical protein n=1 Tax=Halorubrum ezzemoulense TaxID=337243 RepID=UPI00232CC3B4|nr:hypothetical protein [Halorubrum ezzemoulense]MDB9235817.1 hypothetical protein [Halorubrum ezzemoulense]